MNGTSMRRLAAAGVAVAAALAFNALPAGTTPAGVPMTPHTCSSAAPPATTHPTRGCSYWHRRDGGGAQQNPGNKDHENHPPGQTGDDKPGNGPKQDRGNKPGNGQRPARP